MAEPKLDIDKRLNRIELAILTLAARLSIDQSKGLSLVDLQEIEKILRREVPK